jgi:CspA family cold shock protein
MYSINNMSSSKDSVTLLKATTSGERLIGRVKWFNNKAGYGFVTVTDGDQSGSDIFVHHSSIGVSSQQYKYLVQGEYIEFSISATQNGAHPFQASNICGIKGGKLMCETRNEFKIARNNYKTSDAPSSTVVEPVKTPQQKKAPRDEDQKEWTLIKGNKQPEQTQAPPQASNTVGGGRGAGATSGRGSGRGRGRPRTNQVPK